MPFDQIYVSNNRAEWWYGHLTTALARHVRIERRPMARYNQPGHPVEADLAEIIGTRKEENAFYLGSFDQMFRGLDRLPMPTAIWADSGGPHSSYFVPCLRLFDVVFCAQKDAVAEFKSAGIPQVEWLPFGFDTDLKNEPGAEKRYEIGFVGSLELPLTRNERIALLGRLERKYRLNDYRAPVFGDEMMRVYNQSQIVVNIPVPGGFNMRTFEAMASGSMLLTKRIGNGQEDLFKEGVHFATYRDADDLMDKVDYYLRNDRERQEIARAGMREVLAKHSYGHRAGRMIEVMENAGRLRSVDRQAVAAGYAAFYNYLGRADLLGGLAFSRGVPLTARVRMATRAAWRFYRHAAEVRRRA